MSEEDKQRQRDRFRRALRHLIPREEELRRKAGKRLRGRLPERVDDEDEEATFTKMRRQPRTPPAKSALGDTAAACQPNCAEFAATVTWLGRGRARLLAADGEHEAMLAADLAAAQRSAIAVGDLVVVHERDDAPPLVAAVQPRRSALARACGDHGDRQILAANVDHAVLVLAAERPRTGLIDRLRAALADSGAALLVVVNKCDLPHDAEALRRALDPYRDQGVAVCLVSALRGSGLGELRAHLAGATAAFVGHSGVGKSTLLNALDPGAARSTGEVREHDGRGRHTTTATSLRRLADGTQLIDTPGVRMFGLVAAASDAAAAFPEIAELAAGCRFRDCRHVHEPGCAVRRALETGELAADRHAAYLRLLDPGR
ncbi:MAG: ribosome small subunit-dependent GTPase A [Planctomycetes bacterium]|nr:ribosome small subunit-dependent GTPase A [Planctomycetota bacterium]